MESRCYSPRASRIGFNWIQLGRNRERQAKEAVVERINHCTEHPRLRLQRESPAERREGQSTATCRGSHVKAGMQVRAPIPTQYVNLAVVLPAEQLCVVDCTVTGFVPEAVREQLRTLNQPVALELWVRQDPD